MRLFFSADLFHAYADVEEISLSDMEYVSKEKLDPMGRIIKDKKEAAVDNSEKVCSKKSEKKNQNSIWQKLNRSFLDIRLKSCFPILKNGTKKLLIF
jgi:hypothetical protein